MVRPKRDHSASCQALMLMQAVWWADDSGLAPFPQMGTENDALSRAGMFQELADM